MAKINLNSVSPSVFEFKGSNLQSREAIVAEGKSVVVQETIPEKLRYRSVEILSGKED